MEQKRGTKRTPTSDVEFTGYVAMALEAERGAARLSIEALADQSGVPLRTLYRVLHAERDINVEQLAQLARVFGIEPAEIIVEAQRRRARDNGRVPTQHGEQHP
jgi:transcriptional regulator with XRE-family HTH domain